MDTQSLATPPTQRPSMERRTRTRQLQLHKETSSETHDPIMAKLLKDMQEMHGKCRNPLIITQSTRLNISLPEPMVSPMSPQKPKASRNLPPRKAKAAAPSYCPPRKRETPAKTRRPTPKLPREIPNNDDQLHEKLIQQGKATFKKTSK